jgi:MerR HTH family regulatory protein
MSSTRQGQRPDPDEMLPERQVAEYFNVVTRTTARWEKMGLLPPATRIRGRKYRRRADLEKLARQSFGPRPNTPDTEIEPQARPSG